MFLFFFSSYPKYNLLMSFKQSAQASHVRTRWKLLLLLLKSTSVVGDAGSVGLTRTKHTFGPGGSGLHTLQRVQQCSASLMPVRSCVGVLACFKIYIVVHNTSLRAYTCCPLRGNSGRSSPGIYTGKRWQPVRWEVKVHGVKVRWGGRPGHALVTVFWWLNAPTSEVTLTGAFIVKDGFCPLRISLSLFFSLQPLTYFYLIVGKSASAVGMTVTAECYFFG